MTHPSSNAVSLCDDCPPEGYITDKTRCAPCPRRSPEHNVCEKCGAAKEWRECYNCEDGFSHHDCGEDCCCCLDPEDNVTCDICEGEGGWFQCRRCYKGGDWE